MYKKENDIRRYPKNFLWSVRMRASKRVGSQKSKVPSQEIHISGAEGLYELAEIEKIAKNYFRRAMNHPRGKPDKVVITVEKVEERPVHVTALPFSTVRCDSPGEARHIIMKLLLDVGVSEKAIWNGMRIVYAKTAKQGASLVMVHTGIRAEPDMKRGVRVSRLGIQKSAERYLSMKLSKVGINTTTVKEALILASKVSSCKGIAAELCISDEPDYTTGYVASKELGYVRIPNIKKKGSPYGGRVFFLGKHADVERIIEYLERTPVIVRA